MTRTRGRIIEALLLLLVFAALWPVTGCVARLARDGSKAPEVSLTGYMIPSELVFIDGEGWSGSMRVFGSRLWSWSEYTVELPIGCRVRSAGGAVHVLSKDDSSPEWHERLADGGTAVTVSGTTVNGGDTIQCTLFDPKGDDQPPLPSAHDLPRLEGSPSGRALALSGYVVEVIGMASDPSQMLVTLSLPGEDNAAGSSPGRFQVFVLDDATEVVDVRMLGRARAETLRLLGRRRTTAAQVELVTSSGVAYARKVEVAIE